MTSRPRECVSPAAFGRFRCFFLGVSWWLCCSGVYWVLGESSLRYSLCQECPRSGVEGGFAGDTCAGMRQAAPFENESFLHPWRYHQQTPLKRRGFLNISEHPSFRCVWCVLCFLFMVFGPASPSAPTPVPPSEDGGLSLWPWDTKM